jgi:ABC-type sugar transport system ATPase subunit
MPLHVSHQAKERAEAVIDADWHGIWVVAFDCGGGMSSIAFVSVCKRYGNVEAVKDLDLVCAEGEMLALLGPSGCGKSSTLKMAAGIEGVSGGEILIGKRPVSRLAPGQRNIAMVFEDYALYPHLTARENIAFPLAVRGARRAEIAARVGQAMSLLRLEGLADRGVRTLSGGAQQRISIGRALVRDPEVILFDEPLSHLDADQKVHLRSEIRRLQKIKAVTSILVTHDQTEATAMADRIAVMNGGVLQQVAPPGELYERPANLFVAGFIGEPPMNLLPVRAEDGRIRVVATGWELPLGQRLPKRAQSAGTGRDMTAGIRPEHVVVAPASRAGDRRAVVRYREPRGDVDVVVAAPIGHGGATIVAEVPGPSGYRAEDVVGIDFVSDRIHLFAGADGRNVETAP